MNDSYQENAVRAISRRNFLKLMGIAGVTAAMGGAFTGCSSNGADS